jgi:hypothetical protein
MLGEAIFLGEYGGLRGAMLGEAIFGGDTFPKKASVCWEED